MARYSKDHGARSISIGPAIAAGQPNENANTTPRNNGTATGPGDEFGVVAEYGMGYAFPFNIGWDIAISGGTMTALTVALEASDDGVNWFQLDTNNSATGGRKVVANTIARFLRANITTFTANTGTPVVTVGITL